MVEMRRNTLFKITTKCYLKNLEEKMKCRLRIMGDFRKVMELKIKQMQAIELLKKTLKSQPIYSFCKIKLIEITPTSETTKSKQLRAIRGIPSGGLTSVCPDFWGSQQGFAAQEIVEKNNGQNTQLKNKVINPQVHRPKTLQAGLL